MVDDYAKQSLIWKGFVNNFVLVFHGFIFFLMIIITSSEEECS